MDDPNPYASPQYAPTPVNGAGEVADDDPKANWRWENYLLLPREGTLPPRCVRCGEPTDLPLRKKSVQWYNPWLALTILLSVPIFVILALVFQKKGVVYFTLCDAHARRRRRMIAAAWGIGFLGVAQMGVIFSFIGRPSPPDWAILLIFTGIATMIAGAVVGSIGSRTIHVQRIDKHAIWLKKLPPTFYDHLPQLPTANGSKPLVPVAR